VGGLGHNPFGFNEGCVNDSPSAQITIAQSPAEGLTEIAAASAFLPRDSSASDQPRAERAARVSFGSFTSIRVRPLFWHCGNEFLRQSRDGPKCEELSLGKSLTVCSRKRMFRPIKDASPPRRQWHASRLLMLHKPISCSQRPGRLPARINRMRHRNEVGARRMAAFACDHCETRFVLPPDYLNRCFNRACWKIAGRRVAFPT
jgi:hypothetical protein